jgi:farnesyl diphosphate synthase
MQGFEAYLRDHLPSVETFHHTYIDALSDMLLAGGKRFRPMLLLRIVEAYEPLLVESAYAPALALEMFHTYSLIHDDLPSMDDADLRRGHPTLHTTYDVPTAILVGDALNTHAFLLLAQAAFREDVRIKLVEILARDGEPAVWCSAKRLASTLRMIPLRLSRCACFTATKPPSSSPQAC